MQGTETQSYTGGRSGGQTHWKASDAELQCIIDSSSLRGGRKEGDRNMVYSPVSIRMGRWLSQLFTDKCTDVLSRCFWEGVRLSTSNRVVAGEEMISVGQTSGSSLSERGSSVLRNDEQWDKGTKSDLSVLLAMSCHVLGLKTSRNH